jgi:hypothetical protein
VPNVQPFKICPFGDTVGVDDDELRKREYFDAFLSVEHDAEVVVVGAGEGAVLAVDVVAHQQTAEMRPHFVELHHLHVFSLVLKEISENLLRNVAHLLQLRQTQSAGIFAAGQVGVVVESFALNFVDFFEFLTLPTVVVLPAPLGSRVSDVDIREEIDGEIRRLYFIHKNFIATPAILLHHSTIGCSI